MNEHDPKDLSRHDPAKCSVCAKLQRIKNATKEELENWVLMAEDDADWQKLKWQAAQKKLDAVRAVLETDQ